MKKMYTASLKQNALIVIACFISCFAIITLNAYYEAKEKPEAPNVSYLAFVSNGFTLTAK